MLLTEISLYLSGVDARLLGFGGGFDLFGEGIRDVPGTDEARGVMAKLGVYRVASSALLPRVCLGLLIWIFLVPLLSE